MTSKVYASKVETREALLARILNASFSCSHDILLSFLPPFATLKEIPLGLSVFLHTQMHIFTIYSVFLFRL